MGRRGEQSMVPRAEFESYYGKPILNQLVWQSPDIPSYLFLGGLAGGSSLLAAGSRLTGRPALARRAELTALAAIAGSAGALVHDLGRPARFLNMLRTFKPTSPMSMGSWLLAAYGPLTGAAAASGVTGLLPRAGRAAGYGAATLGPAVAAYTAVLLSDTAVPAWHDAHRQMPVVFVGSGAMAAGGLGAVLAGGRVEGGAGAARRLATMGWAAEASSMEHLRRRTGVSAEPYDEGRAGRFLRAGKVLGALGIAGINLGRRRRSVQVASGLALAAASLCTRFGVFEAGRQSAADPRYTVVPQRERADAAASA